jgi:hypothetical protein
LIGGYPDKGPLLIHLIAFSQRKPWKKVRQRLLTGVLALNNKARSFRQNSNQETMQVALIMAQPGQGVVIDSHGRFALEAVEESACQRRCVPVALFEQDVGRSLR